MSDMKEEKFHMRSRYHILDFIGTLLGIAGLAKLWAEDGLIPDYIPLEYDGLLLLLVALSFFIPSTIVLINMGIEKDRERRRRQEKD
jgi:hypothetical protein